MAVSISISAEHDSTSVVFEDDDATYWHLFPYFERCFADTGEMVDLYGDAEFIGEKLLAFCLVIEDAAHDAQCRGEEWMVTVGYPNSTPVQKPVSKETILQSIDSLKSMLNRAYNESRSVVCLGD